MLLAPASVFTTGLPRCAGGPKILMAHPQPLQPLKPLKPTAVQAVLASTAALSTQSHMQPFHQLVPGAVGIPAPPGGSARSMHWPGKSDLVVQPLSNSYTAGALPLKAHPSLMHAGGKGKELVASATTCSSAPDKASVLHQPASARNSFDCLAPVADTSSPLPCPPTSFLPISSLLPQSSLLH